MIALGKLASEPEAVLLLLIFFFRYRRKARRKGQSDSITGSDLSTVLLIVSSQSSVASLPY